MSPPYPTRSLTYVKDALVQLSGLALCLLLPTSSLINEFLTYVWPNRPEVEIVSYDPK
jgi:hypothetical protein